MNTRDGSNLILVVDDNLNNLRTLRLKLSKAGYDLLMATNGNQAIEYAQEESPMLILLDVMMPEMDGYETCTILKKNPATRDIPVIFLTAKSEPEDLVRGFNSGCIDYVTKPFVAEELLARVSTHMNLKQLQQDRNLIIAELNDALEHIDTMNRERNAFLRHELHNAIGPILGYSELLLKNASLEDQKRTSWLRKIRDNALSMKDFLAELKRIQGFEMRETELSFSSIDVVGIVRSEAQSVSETFRDAVGYVLDAGEDSLEIDADATFLPGVFRNAIKNAMEHVQSLPEDERRVTICIKKESEAVLIEIVNGGKPMTRNDLIKFFDKFHSTKTHAGGTGLGTTYMRLVVKGHGGHIDVQSDKITGTCVSIRLPYRRLPQMGD